MWRLQFPGYWFSSNSPTLHGILSNIRNAHYISCVSGSHWVDTRVIQSNYNNQLRVGSTMECVDEERLRVFIHSMFAFAFSHHSQLYHCEKQKRRQLSFQSVFVFTHNLLSQLLVDFRGQGHPEVRTVLHTRTVLRVPAVLQVVDVANAWVPNQRQTRVGIPNGVCLLGHCCSDRDLYTNSCAP